MFFDREMLQCKSIYKRFQNLVQRRYVLMQVLRLYPDTLYLGYSNDHCIHYVVWG